MGIPAVVIASGPFARLAAALGSAEGFANINVAEFPGTITFQSEAEIRENLEKTVIDQIVNGLTVQVARTKETIAEPFICNNQDIVFKGTIGEINNFFQQKNWADGMAVMPPTIEKIEPFLKYSPMAADNNIAILPQANLQATPWNIAANAVMAGCEPQHMPLLIAAVRAIADKTYNLTQIGTTGAVHPFLLINGPIARQLGLESGIGTISRGSNTVIGRAIGLIVRNIAGFRPAEMWMGTFGYFLPFVLAEDEYNSPWEPYHIEHGFPKEASTVTAGATINWGTQILFTKPGIKITLELISEGLKQAISPWASLHFGPRSMTTVMLTAPTARAISAAGYSKRDVARWLFNNTTTTIKEANYFLANCSEEHKTVSTLVKEGKLPPEFNKKPTEKIPIMADSDLIHIIVCGDSQRSKGQALWSPYVTPVTKEIELPENWI